MTNLRSFFRFSEDQKVKIHRNESSKRSKKVGDNSYDGWPQNQQQRNSKQVINFRELATRHNSCGQNLKKI